jgi:DNA-binding CsgD family transcriptional regulator
LRTARKLERGVARNSLPAVADARADLQVFAHDHGLGDEWSDELLRLLARGVQAQEARRAALNGDSALARSALTPTELRVFKLLAGGFSTAEIATQMRKARGTVAMQSRCILARLGAVNIAHATAIGFVNGLVDERDLETGVDSVPRQRPNIRGVKLRTRPLLPEHERERQRRRSAKLHEGPRARRLEHVDDVIGDRDAADDLHLGRKRRGRVVGMQQVERKGRLDRRSEQRRRGAGDERSLAGKCSEDDGAAHFDRVLEHDGRFAVEVELR